MKWFILSAMILLAGCVAEVGTPDVGIYPSYGYYGGYYYHPYYHPYHYGYHYYR
jgi:hypothetical protein